MSRPPPESHDTTRPARFAVYSAYLIGSVIALLAAYAYDLRNGLKVSPDLLSPDPRTAALSFAHALALLLPAAVVLAAIASSAEWLLPEPARRIRRLFSLRSAFRGAPDVMGQAVAATLAAVGAALGVFRVVVYALEAFHAQIVIASFLAVAAPLVVAVSAGVALRLGPPLTRFWRGLEGAGSPAVFLAVVLVVAIACSYHLAEAMPDFDRGLPWPTIRLAVIFGATLVVANATFRDGIRSGVRTRRAGLAGLVVILVSATASVLFYGRTTSQRGFVEELTWSTRLSHRLWSELLDRDGDGHPALLGGRDCDDRRASVHPGAIDVPGDHVDSDCFGGDGTPRFEDRAVLSQSSPVLTDGSAPNVLLISVDTMRPDRLGVLGNRRGITPELDRFARDAVVFSQVESSSPRTTRSIPAIFTGQHPASLAFDRSLNRLDLALSVETLAERMASRYETRAFLGTSYFELAPNLLQGFTRIEQANVGKAPPSFVTDLTIQWLGTARPADKPFFVWAHYFCPHEPYLVDRTPSRFGSRPQDLYDTEVFRADHEIGRLMNELRVRGLDRNTVVIVFSDHGESLGEHGVWGHSSRLTEDQLRSVLMIRAPGIAGRVESTPVALFDVHATVLDVSGIPAAGPESARSLLPLMRGDRTGYVDRPLFAEILPDAVYAIETQSIRVGDDKLIFFPRTGRYALYDLARDPGELRDVADRDPRTARTLHDRLLAWDVASHRPENRMSQLIHDAQVDEIPIDATRLDARFANGITLVGARIRDARVSRTGEVTADLYFRAERPITSEYFVHFTYELADTATRSGAELEAHHTPLDGSFPTTMWRPGIIYRDTVVLRVPSQAQPGVNYLGQVELWSHFHVRTPVAVEAQGVRRESVRFGSLRFY